MECYGVYFWDASKTFINGNVLHDDVMQNKGIHSDENGEQHNSNAMQSNRCKTM